ncbi:MAG: hypothetical protein HGA36_02645 [Candidatus Moranbacteria bacterium]|nr:hypothetical protein [Candidatus Moranbacteria bacterium]
MIKKFIPNISAVMIYTKEFSQRLRVLEKLESNQKYSPSRIEEIAYNEMRNHRRELFENPIEWRIAIMKQYRAIEKNEYLKETSNDNKFHTDLDTEKKSIANGLNPHDRDEDEPIEEIKIVLPEIKTAPKTIDDKENARLAPMIEGRVNISCISKEAYRKKLEDEHTNNIQKRTLR